MSWLNGFSQFFKNNFVGNHSLEKCVQILQEDSDVKKSTKKTFSSDSTDAKKSIVCV